MTRCTKGQHAVPIEDEAGAYCPEHGVTLVWHSPPASDASDASQPDTPGDTDEMGGDQP
ncbi:hypothetical protein ACFYYH_27970 [Streptomyces sp. NPDC002018]|uniref:hypothetical protein n=1 Tax=Streptomyces sp. NPDC002018 TaxID=3364629 RepID=UPI0036883976